MIEPKRVGQDLALEIAIAHLPFVQSRVENKNLTIDNLPQWEIDEVERAIDLIRSGEEETLPSLNQFEISRVLRDLEPYIDSEDRTWAGKPWQEVTRIQCMSALASFAKECFYRFLADLAENQNSGENAIQIVDRVIDDWRKNVKLEDAR